VADCLPSKCETLSSNPSTAKKKKKKKSAGGKTIEVGGWSNETLNSL
jgi:hypothetical protein